MTKIKVLVVDDEALERILIIRGFDWDKHGFEIIGEAGNGEEALSAIEIVTPDIIITDINMPYMDGLAFIEALRVRNLLCKIVIITGYREFEYARKAVQLGVNDFILKPVNIEELGKVMAKIKEELMREKIQSSEMNILREAVHENQSIVMESFFQRLVQNRIPKEEALRKLALYGLQYLITQNFCINIRPHSIGDHTENIQRIRGLLKVHADKKSIVFTHYLNNIIIYQPLAFEEDGMLQANRYHSLIWEHLKIPIDIGYSKKHEGFEGIHEAYGQSEKALSATVILGRNRCISYNEFLLIKASNQEKIRIDWQDFIQQTKSGFAPNVHGYIETYTQAIKNAGITDTGYLKLMTMNMLAKASVVLTQRGTSLADIVGEAILYQQIEEIRTVEEMKRCLKKMTEKILGYQNALPNKKENKLVRQAVDYIHMNLQESTLSLKTIAGNIYTNESYLSRVFKKEMDESLIKYITRLRIEKSVQLLNTTDKKVYEIAEEVGISDPHYFSICFKKHMGITVQAYKNPKSL